MQKPSHQWQERKDCMHRGTLETCYPKGGRADGIARRGDLVVITKSEEGITARPRASTTDWQKSDIAYDSQFVFINYDLSTRPLRGTINNCFEKISTTDLLNGVLTRITNPMDSAKLSKEPSNTSFDVRQLRRTSQSVVTPSPTLTAPRLVGSFLWSPYGVILSAAATECLILISWFRRRHAARNIK